MKIRDLKNRLSFALICVHLISRSGSINITSCTIMFPSGGKSKVALVRSVSDVSNFDAFVPNGSTFTCLSSLSSFAFSGRELGSYALDEYTSVKAVHWNFGEKLDWPF